MATSTYLQGRKKWTRPQAIIFANNSGDLDNGVLTISGVEGTDFIILSDHNRSELSFSQQRIENKKRTINGALRSYHVADKTTFSVSWEMLPSRAFSDNPQFSPTTGLPTSEVTQYIVDGGAGGVDLIEWYENNTGSFYVFLSYDRFDKFNAAGGYLHLSQYCDVLEVYCANFDYSVVKRGETNHDFWNINLSLEEV